eukprot:jgi/Botrbrau1/4257/Bobra.0044s0051.1
MGLFHYTRKYRGLRRRMLCFCLVYGTAGLFPYAVLRSAFSFKYVDGLFSLPEWQLASIEVCFRFWDGVVHMRHQESGGSPYFGKPPSRACTSKHLGCTVYVETYLKIRQ